MIIIKFVLHREADLPVELRILGGAKIKPFFILLTRV